MLAESHKEVCAVTKGLGKFCTSLTSLCPVLAPNASWPDTRNPKEVNIKTAEEKKQPACWNVWISLGYIMTIKLSKKLKNTHVFKPCLISLRFSLGREKGKIIIIKSITRRLDLALLPVEGLLGPLPDQTSLVPGDDPAGAPATVQYHMLFRGLNLKNETILCACVTLLCPSPRCFPTCKIIAASTRLSEWRFRVLSAKHGFEVVLMAAFIAP